MITPHFYIRNDAQKICYQKIDYQNVCMVYFDGSACHIHLDGHPSVKVSLSISDCHMKYFKGQDEFIRASPDYLININHIVGAGKVKNGYLDVFLTNGNRAMLRISHLYAKRIMASDRKMSSLASVPRLVTDSMKKDELILEYNNPLQAKRKIREELNEKVSVGYIRSRYKILSAYD